MSEQNNDIELAAGQVTDVLVRFSDDVTWRALKLAVAVLKGSDRDVERVRREIDTEGRPGFTASLSAAGLARCIQENATMNATRLKARLAEETIREGCLGETMLSPAYSVEVKRYADAWRDQTSMHSII